MNEENTELSTAAIAIWHYWRMEEKSGKEAWTATLATRAAQLQRIDMFRAELQRLFGERSDITLRLNGGCVEAEVEDLRFIAYEFPAPKGREHVMLVTLLGRCPCCGVETMSEPFYNLAGLGKMLENFKPIHQHSCFASTTANE